MARKSGIDNLKTPDQLDAMFETAAKIKDPKLAVQMAFLLIVPSILTARPGETLHTFEEENVIRSKIGGKIVYFRIPHFIDVESLYATELAKRSSDQNASFADLEDEEYQNEGWSSKSEAANRLVPVLRKREREIIELFFDYYDSPLDIFEHPNTLRRRLRRLAELTSGVDAAQTTTQGMRASCAVYWASLGMRPHYLQQMFGWKYLSTSYYYIMVSGEGIREEKQRILDMERSSVYDVTKSPQCFTEIRENADELINVQRITPQTDRKSSDFPSGGGDPLEVHAQTALNEFVETVLVKDGVHSDQMMATDPVSPVVRKRLARERKLIEESPDPDIGFEKRRTAIAGGGLALGAVLMGTTLALNGFWEGLFAGNPTEVGSTVIAASIGLLYMTWDTHEHFHNDSADVEPESLVDKAIITTHATVDPIASRIGKYLPDWW